MVPLNRINTVANIVVSTIIVGVSAWFSWIHWQALYKPPIKYLSATVLNRVIGAGETLDIRVTADRWENCFGHADRTIVKTGVADDFISRSSVPLAPTRIGESISFIVHVPTPKDIKPGVYSVRITSIHKCSHGTFTREIPEITFMVCSAEKHCEF